jgi:hypothetical protein
MIEKTEAKPVSTSTTSFDGDQLACWLIQDGSLTLGIDGWNRPCLVSCNTAVAEAHDGD